jgi:hypothetical protein
MKDAHYFYKGDRNYLHGTTLFDYIIKTYIAGKYEPQNIDFSINKTTNKICQIIPNNEAPELDKLVGQYKDHRSHLFIYETDKTISSRISYNEEEITKKCVIKDRTIDIPPAANKYSFIEQIVAAYKDLLMILFNTSYGKYMLARILIDYMPDNHLSLTHDRIISNRYFQGTIKENKDKIGSIFFGIHKQ